jgi:hypothetical protein
MLKFKGQGCYNGVSTFDETNLYSPKEAHKEEAL